MSLRESQNFFYNLITRPDVIVSFKKNRTRVLRRFFRSEQDRQALSRLPFERFQAYRDNIVVGLLGRIADAFPVLRSLVSEKEWNDLLSNFYLKRLTRLPIARQVFQEFSHYVQKSYRGPLLKRLPYLREFAECENAELLLFCDIDRPHPALSVTDLTAVRNPEAVLKLKPVLNPHHILRTYHWPVHRICKEFSSPKKVRPGNFSLVVYRDPNTGHIRFMESNPLVAKLLKISKSGQKTIGQALKGLLKTRRVNDITGFVREGIAVIQLLSEKGVILGFRK